MQHFIDTIDGYVMTEVIQAAWINLKAKLTTLDVFEDLINLHSEYLDYILDKCFISKSKQNRLMTTLDQMFGFVLRLSQNIKEHGVEILTDFQARTDFRSVRTSFTDYSKFLLQVLK